MSCSKDFIFCGIQKTYLVKFKIIPTSIQVRLNRRIILTRGSLADGCPNSFEKRGSGKVQEARRLDHAPARWDRAVLFDRHR